MTVFLDGDGGFGDEGDIAARFVFLNPFPTPDRNSSMIFHAPKDFTGDATMLYDPPFDV